MKPYLALLLFLALVLMACEQKPSQNLMIECPDGRLVANMSECDVIQEEEAVKHPAQLNKTRPQPVTEEEPEEDEFRFLRRNYSNSTDEPKGEHYLDLNGWSAIEIVHGMGSYDDKFIGIFPKEVHYTKQRTHYTLGSGYKAVEDPFWIARSHFQSGNKEYDVNRFRINLVQTPYEFYDMVMQKHNDTKFKILWPQEWQEWSSIDCVKLNVCRDIEAVRCMKSDHELYMWSHMTPGEGYTDAERYSMQAMDDEKETLDTFEELYCTPI